MFTILLDTETSGLTGNDRVVELGIVILDENFQIVYSGSDYCKINFKLSKDVTEYTGINDSHLENAKSLKETNTYLKLKEYNNKNNIVVIHNSWFDLYMLYMSHVQIECRVVDTLNCARQIYHDKESYSLINLINTVVEKPSDAKPMTQSHRAKDDCHLLLMLLKDMLKYKTMLDLLFMTERWVVGFGKHKGKLWKDLDNGYLKWVHNSYSSENSPTQLYIKTLLKMKLSPQQEKMLEYLHIN